MGQQFQMIEGSITRPRGFRAAGVFCDIRRLGEGTVKGWDGDPKRDPKRDLMLIAVDRPAAVAGMFTTSQVCAAPVKVSLRHARKTWAQAIVANSVVVKTSSCGGDPNWGRIMDAVGYSPARIIEEKVDLGYSPPGSRNITRSLRRGLPTGVDFATLCACVAPAEFDLHIRLNLGQGEAVVYACDLSEAHVEFNKGDISDPTALGG